MPKLESILQKLILVRVSKGYDNLILVKNAKYNISYGYYAFILNSIYIDLIPDNNVINTTIENGEVLNITSKEIEDIKMDIIFTPWLNYWYNNLNNYIKFIDYNVSLQIKSRINYHMTIYEKLPKKFIEEYKIWKNSYVNE